MKIDENTLSLDLQSIILAGMTFEKLCDYVSVITCKNSSKNNEED